MEKFKKSIPKYLPWICIGVVTLAPALGLCSVESSLSTLQSRLLTVVLPLVSIVGLLFGAMSFALGNPNGRNHLIMSCIGAGLGFGAPSIIAFIRGIVS
jgi:hypothetical protein